VIVDDLEKGESDAHKQMHSRLFQTHFDTLVQPRFSLLYTLPVYFRALEGSRIPADQIYAFPAARLYLREDKYRDEPPLARDSEGYQLMHRFVCNRVADRDQLIGETELDRGRWLSSHLTARKSRPGSSASSGVR
jgi:hypothetical protein